MPASHPIAAAPQSVPLARIERPRCPTCDCRMPLARIMTGPSGLDRRSFTCTTCDRDHKASLKTSSKATSKASSRAWPTADPMNADTLGWLFADLNPPN